MPANAQNFTPTQPQANPNAWQNSPQTQGSGAADAWRYYQSNPTNPNAALNYQLTQGGMSPNQIMQAGGPQAASAQSGLGQGSTAPGQTMDGAALWSMLSAQNGPANSNYDLMNQLLQTQQGQETKMNGLKSQDLRDQTSITINRADKEIQNANLTAQNAQQKMGFVNQLYGEQNKQSGLQYGAQRSALLSDATARGAVNAHGTVGQFKNQYEQFQNQLAGNLTQKNQSMADLQMQQKQAENLAQQYGLDKTALTDRLNNGLAQLGLQGQMDAGDILKGIYSNDASKAGLAQSLVQQFMSMAGGNPQFLQGTPLGQQGSTPSQQYSAGGGVRVQ